MSDRKTLPNPRRTLRWHLRLLTPDGAEHSVYLDVGHFADGTPGEMFVVLAKEGSTLRGMTDAWSQCFSYALQWGVPLERLVRAWRWSRFEPAGRVEGHPDVVRATSIPDMIVQVLAVEYLAGAPRNGVADETPVGLTYVPALAAAAEGRTPGSAKKSSPEGAVCKDCGSPDLLRSGTCLTCQNCGSTSGCS